MTVADLNVKHASFDTLSSKDGEQEVSASKNLRETIKEWTQNTTFHGIRNIGNNNSVCRRLMWLLFVLACLIAVIFQIVDRVGYYYDWPLNVNVKINYNQTLDFPAVTLCNQNAFRATQAAKYGRYRLVEEMFAHSANITIDDLERHNATDLSLEELYTSLAHRKEDFIKSCSWKNAPCGHKDFTTVVTDHGVCYSFIRNQTDMLVSSSGVDSGLRLTLNVEQYEYMTGPHDSAGVKILLHDAKELPFVHELGQAVPTGTHAFFGVKFMTIDNLPKPYGECDTKKLSHTDNYSTEECYIDCLVKLAKSRCECRDTYMPHFNGSPPVCTLGEYYSCLRDLEDRFDRSLRQECGCPVPCRFAIYDPSVSYASMSNHLVDKLLTAQEAIVLKRRLLVASEVTSKMDMDRFVQFKNLARNTITNYENVQEVIKKIGKCLVKQTNKTNGVLEEMRSAYLTKERIYRYQEYSIQKNFLRGREAMEERTLSNVANAYAEFALVNTNRIRRLGSENDTSEDNRYELYKLIIDTLKTRQEICKMARANVSLLISSFITGKPIFNYKFEDLPRAHNPYIVPKPLLNYSMHHNHYMIKYVPKLKTPDFDILNDTLTWLMEQATIAFENRTINESRLNYVYERFQFACRTYMFSKSIVYSLGIELPLKVIQDRHQDFDDTWTSFEDEITEMKQNIKSLDALIENITRIVMPKFAEIDMKLSNYSDIGESNLMDIANVILSNETQFVTNKIRSFFREVQIRGQLIDDLINMAINPVLAMWTTIIDDEDSIEYYNYTNNLLFLRNLTEVEDEWTQKIAMIKANDVRRHVMNYDEEFFAAFDEISLHLADFKNSIRVDNVFLKENFLQIDIFYRQLSYEHVNQQKAYDFFALVSDIGGAMGLFIGASMLTILEIIDLFLIQLPIFKHKNEMKKKSYA